MRHGVSFGIQLDGVGVQNLVLRYIMDLCAYTLIIGGEVISDQHL